MNRYRKFFLEGRRGRNQLYTVLSSFQVPTHGEGKIIWHDEEMREEDIYSTSSADSITAHLLGSIKTKLTTRLEAVTKELDRLEQYTSSQAHFISRAKHDINTTEVMLHALLDKKEWMIPHSGERVAIVIVDGIKERIVCVATPQAYSMTFREQFLADPFKRIPETRALGDIF